jgi:hypothetical protein
MRSISKRVCGSTASYEGGGKELYFMYPMKIVPERSNQDGDVKNARNGTIQITYQGKNARFSKSRVPIRTNEIFMAPLL